MSSNYPPAQTHTLMRTNPKGKGIDFIGRCALCGAEGLPAEAAMEPCTNPTRIAADDAFMLAIEGDEPATTGGRSRRGTTDPTEENQ